MGQVNHDLVEELGRALPGSVYCHGGSGMRPRSGGLAQLLGRARLSAHVSRVGRHERGAGRRVSRRQRDRDDPLAVARRSFRRPAKTRDGVLLMGDWASTGASYREPAGLNVAARADLIVLNERHLKRLMNEYVRCSTRTGYILDWGSGEICLLQRSSDRTGPSA